MLAQILLQLVLIFLNAVFACAEIAVLSIGEVKLKQLDDSGNKRAHRLLKLTEQPAKFLATIQVAITLSGFLASAFAAEAFSDKLVVWVSPLLGDRIPYAVLDKAAVVLITLLLSYFTLVFGELVPKRLAMKKTEKMALGLSALVRAISVIFSPLVWLLTVSTNGVLRLFGIDPKDEEETVTEEEIKYMVDAGSERGSIDESEKTMIQNVFEFDDLAADEIATHRTDICLLWMDESPEEWENTIRESRFTRYPICDETIDNVVAILNAKEYFRLQDKSRENVMKNATRAPYFVPESVKADVLFRNMKMNKDYFAVVLDEYGGVSGIVTVTDLLECIVGDFSDTQEGTEEADEPYIVPLDSGTWNILGTTPIRDVEEALEMELGEGEKDYDTFAGYLLSVLGAIPEDGAQIVLETEDLTVRITEVKDHRIERTHVCKNEHPTSEGEEKEEA